jgi:hypothetical protein
MRELARLLSLFSDKSCSDERDKIYALTGILRETRSIDVDYAQSKHAMTVRIALQPKIKHHDLITQREDLLIQVGSIANVLRVTFVLRCGGCLLRHPCLEASRLRDSCPPDVESSANTDIHFRTKDIGVFATSSSFTAGFLACPAGRRELGAWVPSDDSTPFPTCPHVLGLISDNENFKVLALNLEGDPAAAWLRLEPAAKMGASIQLVD